MVRFMAFGAHLRQGIGEPAQMLAAAGREQTLLHLGTVCQQADAISTMRRDLRQRKRGIDSVVQLGQAQGAGGFLHLSAQQASGIQHQPHGLAALHLENASDEAMPSRGRRPGDVPEVVALADIRAKYRVHVPARAGGAGAIPSRYDGCGSDGTFACGLPRYSGGRGRPGRCRRRRAVPPGASAGLVSQKDAAQASISALSRQNGIGKVGGTPSGQGGGQCSRLRRQRRGRFVHDQQIQEDSRCRWRCWRPHSRGHAESGPHAPFPSDHNLFRTRQCGPGPKPMPPRAVASQKNMPATKFRDHHAGPSQAKTQDQPDEKVVSERKGNASERARARVLDGGRHL